MKVELRILIRALRADYEKSSRRRVLGDFDNTMPAWFPSAQPSFREILPVLMIYPGFLVLGVPALKRRNWGGENRLYGSWTELAARKCAVLPVCEGREVLNGGSAYGPYNVNRIPLTSDPMLVALLSDPMIRIPLS